MIDEVKCLASYVTYRQLYDNGRNDVYFVVSKFAENIIITKRLYSFGITQLTEEMKNTFGFSIPEYVVQSAIKRIDAVTRENKSYSVNTQKLSDSAHVSESIESSSKENEKVSQKLIQFVEEKKGVLSTAEKEKVQREFCAFLLNDSHNGYSDVISAFIIENAKDDEIQNCISKIKEGAVLFAGLNYNSNIADKSAWSDRVRIYVETEILFHLAGYNGLVFQKLAEDLFSLISEMNLKGAKRSIQVRYFKEVSEEIDRFFKTAQDIVEGKATVSIENYAMAEIVKGCEGASDVIDKKTFFFNLLKSKGIIEETEENYYCDENHKYNLESQDIISKYEIADEKIRYIKHLNYVNILRKGIHANDLRKCQYVVLTETWKMLKIASDLNDNIEKIPLAINMYLLTNRLWFDMNKGFGSKELPSSFDVLTRARIVLSNVLTQNVAKKYDEVQRKFVNKEMNENQLIDNVISLREEIKKPEDIFSDHVDDILQFISEDSINIYKSEKELLANKVQEYEKEKNLLVEDIRKRQEENIKIANEKKEIINREKKVIQEQLVDIQERKKKADGKIEKRQKRVKRLLGGVSIGYYAGVFILFWKLSSDYREILSFILALVPSGISLLVSLKTEKSLSIFELYKCILRWHEKQIRNKIYEEYSIDTNKIIELEEQLSKFDADKKR